MMFEDLETEGLTEDQIGDVLADPFYCLGDGVYGAYTEPHTPLVSEEMWIAAGIKSIEQEGAEKYLQRVLKNLKGKGAHWVPRSHSTND